jgi:hypothetical protein
MCTERNESLTKSADGRVDDSLAWLAWRQLAKGAYVCFPSPGYTRLWLAAAPVKAPDELAPLGLDRRLASRKSPDIRAKENIRYELTQPQWLLTSTGLLMEGRVAH